MRSLRFAAFGDPEQVLHLDEIPKPTPGPGQALIRMRVRPINPSDVLTIAGLYGAHRELPSTPGYEGMGVVESVGDGVTGWAPGRRVIPWTDSGTWQEWVVAEAQRLLPVPDSVPDSSAAQFVVNPLTAWVMIVEDLQVPPGGWLLQTAAGSTLGRVALQIAKERGIKTINVVRRRAQVEEIRALGGDEVICTEDEELVSLVDEITQGEGVRWAIDAVSGQTGSDVSRTLAIGGVMLVYGVLSFAPITLDPSQLLFKASTVRGFWLSRWFQQTPREHQRSTMATVMNLMASGKIVPPVDSEYDLADFKEAVHRAQSPGLRGKILLTG